MVDWEAVHLFAFMPRHLARKVTVMAQGDAIFRWRSL
jgi:hypothetical protein